MEHAKEILLVCHHAEKATTIQYRDRDVTGFIKAINRIMVVLEQLQNHGDLEIPLSEVQDVLYPVVQRTSEGVFKIVEQGPSC